MNPMGSFFSFGRGRRGIILDVVTMERWPQRLVRHQGLETALTEWTRAVEEARGAVERAAQHLSDPALLDRIPERAQPIYDEHLPSLRSAVQELLDQTVVIADAFLADVQQDDFRAAFERFRDDVRKPSAALKEFLGGELTLLTDAVAGLEDAILSLYPTLEKASFENLKKVKELVEEFKSSREKVVKLEHLKQEISEELEALERKRRKHKEKIAYFMERAKNGKYKELLAEEESLLREQDAIKVRDLPEEEEERMLAPIRQRLSWLRKQMINDITAMNINEQRTFLESVKDDIKLRKRQLERIEERLAELSFDAFRPKFIRVLGPFNARIEEADMILEPEEEDVAPQ